MGRRRRGGITLPLLVALLWAVVEVLLFEAEAISRDDFPDGFTFGAGSSAYQVEGATEEGGRTPSIWDTFAKAGKTMDKSTGDIAADQYHKYKEDVKLMHEMGLDAYRFSISWSRLIPNGRGSVNPEGLQYYNNLINELQRYGATVITHLRQCSSFELGHCAGIEPHVTLHHFDLPQALEDEYKGQLSPKFVEDFTSYANVCFREFGDRVKYWVTFNEPNIEPILGHDFGIFAPGRCSPFMESYGFNCTAGNSSSEPYLVAHHLLLSHASAASLYKQNYQAKQGGQIGITLLGLWYEPFTTLPKDIAATTRAREFHIGWFMNPLTKGTYPTVMANNVGSRLPTFKPEESVMLRGSFDFIGLNHYQAVFLQEAADYPDWSKIPEYYTDMSVSFVAPQTQAIKLFVSDDPPSMPSTPWALQKLLEYMKENYGNPPIMIHENGYAEYNIDPATSEKEYEDGFRARYIEDYLEGMLLAIRNGSNTKGYFAWSLLDCFELVFGYTSRYGLYGVDYSAPNRTRYRRYSGNWYSKFLQPKSQSQGSSGVYVE